MSLQKKFSKSKNACNVTFTLSKEAANGAMDVKLLGDFNNWDQIAGISMKPGDDGFTASLDLNPGKEYEFRYLIDGKTWENDWSADKYVPSPFGVDNSVVVVPDGSPQ